MPPNSRSIYDDVTVAENKLTAANKKYKDDKKAGKADTILQADQQAMQAAALSGAAISVAVRPDMRIFAYTLLVSIATGILFGLVHAGSASSQYLIPLGIFGFVLCLLRWRTGSLYPCMALHSVNNALALGVNQLGWNAAEIIGLMAASLAVIGLLTGPFAGAALPWAARPAATA